MKMTSATAYTVTDPNGVLLPAAAALGAYTDAQINWTITASLTRARTSLRTVALSSAGFDLWSIICSKLDSSPPLAARARATACSCGEAESGDGGDLRLKNIPAAIRAAGSSLFEFHACANDRGTPGEDHLPWDQIAGAFGQIGYDGPVVIEAVKRATSCQR